MGKAPDEWTYGDVERLQEAALVLDETFVTPDTSHQTLETAHGDGVLAERQAVSCTADAEHGRRPCPSLARWLSIEPKQRRAHQRVHRRRLRQQDTGGDHDDHPGAAVEEGQRAGDDAHHPRGRALHRPRAPGMHGRVKVGFAKDGRDHRARHVRRSATTARTTRRATPTPRAASSRCSYQPEAMRWRGVTVLTNTPPRGAQSRRAACRASRMMEPIIAKAARKLGIDQVAIRRINAPAGKAPFGPPDAQGKRQLRDQRVRQGSARQGRGAVQVGRAEGARAASGTASKVRGIGVAISALLGRLDRLRRPVRHQAGRPCRTSSPASATSAPSRSSTCHRVGGRDARRAVGEVRRRLGQHLARTCRGPASRAAARRRTR